jgi:hypothetical protein
VTSQINNCRRRQDRASRVLFHPWVFGKKKVKIETKKKIYQILIGSYSRENEDKYLLGCDAV